MSTSEAGKKQNKVELTYEVLTKLQETLEKYKIVRKEKVYGQLLRICVQNTTQLQKITDIIELMLTTEEIKVEEVAFPYSLNTNEKNGFMLYVKGSPHDAIESVFTQTNIKWKITKVEYKLEEKETVNISSDKSENGGNGNSVHVNTVSENLIRKETDDFLESQYAMLVNNTMKQMDISQKDAQIEAKLWFQWKSEMEQKVKQPLMQADSYHEPDGMQNLLENENGPYNEEAGEAFTNFIGENENRSNSWRDIFDSIFIILIYCLKSLILLSLTILIFFWYTKHSSSLHNSLQTIF